uniref:Sodium channel modifier 1 n=1 Tax=Callorhinchus milii TaxID=7868 RepID=K4FUY1_CALMI|nr:sodium channel modifier 1 [Callorhinchus milii]
MSFKREEGRDAAPNRALQKRRVSDLLSSYIPEDEAFLMKNGRYACTVCSYRPVFDTMDMLAVHRSGRKHLTSLQKFYGKKRDVHLEIERRRHQEYLRGQDTGKPEGTELAPLLIQTQRITRHALLTQAPYSSRCRRDRPERSLSELAPSGGETPAGERNTAWLANREPQPQDTGQSPAAPGHTATPAGSGLKRVRGIERKRRRKSSVSEKPSVSDAADEERAKAMERYLQLKSSGWIRDLSGKWVQDASVEFDSDEEMPPLLPHEPGLCAGERTDGEVVAGQGGEERERERERR